LGSFVHTIPALREKKRIIDVHTNIATALLNNIKERELDTYFSLEENIMTGIYPVRIHQYKSCIDFMFDIFSKGQEGIS
jgi:hypothetical protein